ncbi:hypothetical protein ACIP4X_17775 [Streptomyces sp. NPDC088817]|uniref:hypothetical protein n=1 Tax=Streptomyces sp. NPDC088817 TaxID=3365907 RepID=UPI003811F2BC
MIENTSESMKDPGRALAFLAASMGPGGSDQAVAEQERAGQAQLVNSDRLPTEMQGPDQAAYEAVGFTFGASDPRDPLLRPVTLPDGWKREASDHDMWSYVVDQLGRRRVEVFYKAAFYDRRAFMRLVTVDGYVSHCHIHGTDLVTDDTWATPAAIAEAARSWAKAGQQNADSWAHSDHPSASRWIAEAEADRDAYQAIADRFEAVTEA